MHMTQQTRSTQANRVIQKFGGARKLAAALKVDPTAVYKWTYPVAKQGTGGRIPTGKLESVLRAARREGILLTPDDLWPGEDAKTFR